MPIGRRARKSRPHTCGERYPILCACVTVMTCAQGAGAPRYRVRRWGCSSSIEEQMWVSNRIVCPRLVSIWDATINYDDLCYPAAHNISPIPSLSSWFQSLRRAALAAPAPAPHPSLHTHRKLSITEMSARYVLISIIICSPLFLSPIRPRRPLRSSGFRCDVQEQMESLDRHTKGSSFC